MQINPDRLRELRMQKSLTRQEVAEKSKISPRQISRLESKSASSSATRERTIHQLAKALDVDPTVLTGEAPMPATAPAPRAGDGKRVQVSALLWPEVRLAYALIERRYGVNPTSLFNFAPLMFAILAEGSLQWRREKLIELEGTADNLLEQGKGHLSFAQAIDRIVNAAEIEWQSINNQDLFGKKLDRDTYYFGYDTTEKNPFGDYLRELSKNIDNPGVVDLSEYILGYAALKDLPRYEICSDDLEEITGGSHSAKWALTEGRVSIKDIPSDLWADSATMERVKWLEDRLSQEDREMFDLFKSITVPASTERTSSEEEANS